MRGFQLGPSTLKVDFQVHKLFKWFTAGPYPFVWPNFRVHKLFKWSTAGPYPFTWLLDLTLACRVNRQHGMNFAISPSFLPSPSLLCSLTGSVRHARWWAQAPASSTSARDGGARRRPSGVRHRAIGAHGGARVPQVISFLFFLPQINIGTSMAGKGRIQPREHSSAAMNATASFTAHLGTQGWF
jgi:hypothetical protein